MHFFQSELYTNIKMPYSRQWFENVHQMHLCTFTMAHRELMHWCTSASILNIIFSLLPVDSVHFYVRQLSRQVLLRVHICYGNSVCPSVTTGYRFKTWSWICRDSGSSPYDSLESLVSYEVFGATGWGNSPRTRASKRGTPLEIVILPLLAHLAWKRLHIDTNLPRIITSTTDQLLGGTNIDDLERPWTPKIWVFSDFLLF